MSDNDTILGLHPDDYEDEDFEEERNSQYEYYDKYYGFDISNSRNYQFPLDWDFVCDSKQEAILYLSRELMSRKFGWVHARMVEMEIFPDHLYDNVLVFCDKWDLPFDPELHSQLMRNLQHYNPNWTSSDWSC